MVTRTVSDALVIIRDMASDASQSAANKLRPSEEQLSQVDQAAEENTWHEKPDKEQLKAKFKRNKGVSFSSRIQSKDDTLTHAKDRESVLSGPSANADGTSEVSKSTRRSTKERAREYAGKSKEYLSEKVPKERREQAIWRLKKMVMEVQGHADCKSNSF